ncbi:anthranilate synthase component I [bacterium]|nr:anthranilate synthase component I [bacterium]
MNITREEFNKLAEEYTVIPVYETLPADLETPVSAFLKLRTGHFDFLFESVEGGEKWARYSFLGTTPRKIYRYSSQKIEVSTPDGKTKTIICDDNIFAPLQEEFASNQVYQDPELPRFFGGAVGYLGYDLVQAFEDITLKNSSYEDLPEYYLFLTDCVVIFDSLSQTMKLVNTLMIDENIRGDEDALKEAYDQAITKINFIKDKLAKPARVPQEEALLHNSEPTMNITKHNFCEQVARAKEYIKSGDIFQVVLSLNFEVAQNNRDPISLYRALRRLNPSPYMYYLRFNDLCVVGASPEIMVRLEDNKVEVRPIAGTRKRGKDAQEDQKLEQELKADPKERAEHIMLVDLGRNDLGRVAKTGSIVVDEKEIVERYSHVMHLVSHVSGELAANKNAFDVIKATFPAGTLSGAPKIRAMEIIEELENHSRGIYGGAIGYISYSGNTDLAIAIRTAVLHKEKIIIQAGAGIVHDSDPEFEYEECCNKARGVLDALKSSTDNGQRSTDNEL